jgi:outer membrane protein
MKAALQIFVISFLVSVTILFAYHFLTREKMAYVKTGEILQKYQGMIDANKQFASEFAIVQGNVDTLKNRYERIKSSESSISKDKRSDWAYQLGVAEKEFSQYNQTAQQQIQQRQQQLTLGVLNKINTFIQEYGKKNGYKIILGTTEDGSILYASEKDDLTTVILDEINKAYKK